MLTIRTLFISSLVVVAGCALIGEIIGGYVVNSVILLANTLLALNGPTFETLFDLVNQVTKKTTINEWIAEYTFDPITDEVLTCDFVIVGGGIGGSVLASRLSEVPEWTVCLLEAGLVETLLNNLAGTNSIWTNTPYNWGAKPEAQPGFCEGMRDGQCGTIQGRGMGGGSLVNYMMATRGNPRDFDRLESDFGISGWSYDDILPYFKKTETNKAWDFQGSPYRGDSGPLSVQYSGYRTKLPEAFVAGMQCVGYEIKDPNGNDNLGVSFQQQTMLNGQRHTSARAYIYPNLPSRTNLKIRINSHVTKVLIHPENKTAYGVEYKDSITGLVSHFYAREEVILSAGAFGSPKILMLSGVGPKNHLQSLGIPVIQDSPVGKTLRDHVVFHGPQFLTNTTTESLKLQKLILDYSQPLGSADSVPIIEFLTKGTGPLSSNLVTALGFLNSTRIIDLNRGSCDGRCGLSNGHSPGDDPDMELIFTSGTYFSDLGLGFPDLLNFKPETYDALTETARSTEKDAFMILPVLMDPRSVGYLELKDTNPLSHPKIVLNYYSDPEGEDYKRMLVALREIECIIKTPPFQALGTEPICSKLPGCTEFACFTDDYWKCFLNQTSTTIFHQSATCRMGGEDDSAAVVTADLKVKGIRDLRVVDLSVLPHSTTSHPSLAAYAIGEKAADMIKEAHGKQI